MCVCVSLGHADPGGGAAGGGGAGGGVQLEATTT